MYYLSYILVFNYCLYFTLRHVLFIMQMFIILCIWCLFFIAYIVLLLLFYTCIKILISFYSTYIWFYTKGLDSHDQCSITRCLHWFFQNKNFNYQVLWVFSHFISPSVVYWMRMHIGAPQQTIFMEMKTKFFLSPCS
jgi:hypothetical protein